MEDGLECGHYPYRVIKRTSRILFQTLEHFRLLYFTLRAALKSLVTVLNPVAWGIW